MLKKQADKIRIIIRVESARVRGSNEDLLIDLTGTVLIN